MQNNLQTKKLLLILGLALLTNLTLGQETATEGPTKIEESATTNQSEDDTEETATPTQFVPKEAISPDSVIAFPADI